MLYRHVRPLLTAVAISAAVTACGQYRRVGSETAPSPDVVLPGMFDLASAYHHMGFLAQGSPVPFVGAIRFLAGPTPDSTLAVFSASMANSALSFRRTATGFEASYRIEVSVGISGRQQRISSTETVRVPSFQETQRSDESVIFQKSLLVSPGAASIEVTLRDQSTSG